ncbi:MAG TPA: hypothetical protein VIT65_08185 [Microlunatus sp.]
MAEAQRTARQRPTTSSVRQLLIGLVCVCLVVGGVFAVQSIRRVQWEGRCREAGDQVVRQSGGVEPYLAPGSVTGYTCVDPSGIVISSWP